jgi:hypothetical protein
MSTVVALASAAILHNGAGPLTLFAAAAVGVNVAAFAVWDVRAPPPRPAPSGARRRARLSTPRAARSRQVPKGRAVWNVGAATRMSVCAMSVLVPALALYIVAFSDRSLEYLYTQLAARAAPSNPFPLHYLIGGGIMGLLRLSWRIRAVVSILCLGLANACFVVAYLRIISVPSLAASIGPICSTLACRSISAYAIGLFSSQTAARLLMPCAAIVEVLEETKLDGKTYRALSTEAGRDHDGA